MAKHVPTLRQALSFGCARLDPPPQPCIELQRQTDKSFLCCRGGRGSLLSDRISLFCHRSLLSYPFVSYPLRWWNSNRRRTRSLLLLDGGFRIGEELGRCCCLMVEFGSAKNSAGSWPLLRFGLIQLSLSVSDSVFIYLASSSCDFRRRRQTGVRIVSPRSPIENFIAGVESLFGLGIKKLNNRGTEISHLFLGVKKIGYTTGHRI
jgi:hypothetical protein